MMNIHDTMHFLAQGCINVTEGTEKVFLPEGSLDGTITQLGPKYDRNGQSPLSAVGTFVARESRIHKALTAICELLPPGEAEIVNKPRAMKDWATRPTGSSRGHTDQGWIIMIGQTVYATCDTEVAAESLVTCLNTLAAYFEKR